MAKKKVKVNKDLLKDGIKVKSTLSKNEDKKDFDGLDKGFITKWFY